MAKMMPYVLSCNGGISLEFHTGLSDYNLGIKTVAQ